jgi:hypothetical protein
LGTVKGEESYVGSIFGVVKRVNRLRWAIAVRLGREWLQLVLVVEAAGLRESQEGRSGVNPHDGSPGEAVGSIFKPTEEGQCGVELHVLLCFDGRYNNLGVSSLP